MERFDAPDGTSIAWYEQGSGPPVLVVHGLGESHAGWPPGHDPHLVDPDAFVARLRAFWTRN